MPSIAVSTIFPITRDGWLYDKKEGMFTVCLKNPAEVLPAPAGMKGYTI
jgi:hypothetical protein